MQSFSPGNLSSFYINTLPFASAWKKMQVMELSIMQEKDANGQLVQAAGGEPCHADSHTQCSI